MIEINIQITCKDMEKVESILNHVRFLSLPETKKFFEKYKDKNNYVELTSGDSYFLEYKVNKI